MSRENEIWDRAQDAIDAWLRSYEIPGDEPSLSLNDCTTLKAAIHTALAQAEAQAERAEDVCAAADAYTDCVAEFPDDRAYCSELYQALEGAVIAWKAALTGVPGDRAESGTE